MRIERTVLDGRMGPEHEKSYQYLPFDVPEGATRIDVALDYSHRIGSDPSLAGGNTMDVGLFDERGIAFLTGGFRGYSGSERLAITIAETDATPGYLAGPLNAGRWHLMLGLYKVAPRACRYHVEIAVTIGGLPRAPAPNILPPRDLPMSQPTMRNGPWLCGELHCHSHNSDGDAPPAAIVAMARQRGLDFLAVTDHNTVAASRELASLREPGLVLVPGVEVTTYLGHMHVLGTTEWIDFRALNDREMAEAAAYARARGAVLSCNHPKPLGPDWRFSDTVTFDAVEVWNGPWAEGNEVALAFWVAQLARGRRLTALAGSDYHRRGQLSALMPRAPGTPATWLFAPGPVSAVSILSAIRKGRAVLSCDHAGPLLDLRAGAARNAMPGDELAAPRDGRLVVSVGCTRGRGGRLALLDQGRRVAEQAVRSDEETLEFALPVDGSRFVRAELRDEADNMLALTNPLYLSGPASEPESA